METAKIDIRKLQLLNDRINQTIDALNQVRLSVHGVSPGAGSPFGIPQMGYPVQAGVYGAGPYGQLGGLPLQSGLQGMVPGLSHTAGYGSSQLGQVPGFPMQSNIPGISQALGYGGSQLGQLGQQLGQLGQLGALGQLGLHGLQGSVPGLSHTAGYGSSQLGQVPGFPMQSNIPGIAQVGAFGNPQLGQFGMHPLQSGLQGISQGAGYGVAPQAYGLPGIQNPWLAQSALSNAAAAGLIPQTGLGHTSSEMLEASLGARQALGLLFPFANWNYSPFQSNQ